MTQIILIILGIVIVILLLSRKTREQVVGICSSALDQTVRKNTNKEKIMALLREKGEAGNEDMREYLGVSRQSIVNYTTELEKEGRIEQVGDSGRGVVYRIK